MNRIQTIILAAAASALSIASPAIWAHGDAPDAQPARHGGQIRMAAVNHFELVVAKDSKDAKDNPVIVYVTDRAGLKVSTAGASGTATIVSGTTKVTAPLVADGDNRLKGTANYASSPSLKVVVSIALSGKASGQARFTPLAIEKVENADHKH